MLRTKELFAILLQMSQQSAVMSIEIKAVLILSRTIVARVTILFKYHQFFNAL